jgi:hypothetical protein
MRPDVVDLKKGTLHLPTRWSRRAQVVTSVLVFVFCSRSAMRSVRASHAELTSRTARRLQLLLEQGEVAIEAFLFELLDRDEAQRG